MHRKQKCLVSTQIWATNLEVVVMKIIIELDEIACFSPFSAHSSLAEKRALENISIRGGTRRGTTSQRGKNGIGAVSSGGNDGMWPRCRWLKYKEKKQLSSLIVVWVIVSQGSPKE